jgi:hypothetical protein
LFSEDDANLSFVADDDEDDVINDRSMSMSSPVLASPRPTLAAAAAAAAASAAAASAGSPLSPSPRRALLRVDHPAPATLIDSFEQGGGCTI